MAIVVFNHSNWPLSGFCTYFFLQVFFVISGYLFKPENFLNIKYLYQYIIRKIKSLYLPFVICNLIFMIPAQFKISSNGIIFNGQINDIFIRICKLFLFIGGSQLGGATWFFRVMFGVCILYATFTCIINIINVKHRTFLPCCFSLLCFTIGKILSTHDINMCNIGSIFTCVLIFHIGTMFRNINMSFKFNIFQLMLSFCILYLYYIYEKAILLLPNQNINFIELVFTSIFGFYFISSIASLCKYRHLQKLFIIIGEHTRAILCMHFACFKLITLLQILIFSLPWYNLSAFPILITNNGWFAIYTMFGIGLPIIIVMVINKIFLKYSQNFY